MRTFVRQWRKIYLFYGVIFFSFGLFGFLSKEDLWPLLTLKISDYLKNIRLYSDLPVWDGTEIPVFNAQSSKSAVFYFQKGLEKQPQLLQEIRSILSGYYRKIEFRRVYTGENFVVEISKNGYVSQVDYYGLKLQIDREKGTIRNDLYFDLPFAIEEQLAIYLSQCTLSDLKAERTAYQGTTLYHLQWSAHPAATVSILSEVLSQQVRLRSGNSAKI